MVINLLVCEHVCIYVLACICVYWSIVISVHIPVYSETWTCLFDCELILRSVFGDPGEVPASTCVLADKGLPLGEAVCPHTVPGFQGHAEGHLCPAPRGTRANVMWSALPSRGGLGLHQCGVRLQAVWCWSVVLHCLHFTGQPWQRWHLGVEIQGIRQLQHISQMGKQRGSTVSAGVSRQVYIGAGVCRRVNTGARDSWVEVSHIVYRGVDIGAGVSRGDAGPEVRRGVEMGAAVSRVISIRAVVSWGVHFRAEVISGVDTAAVVGRGINGVLILQAEGLKDPGVHGQCIGHFLCRAEVWSDVPTGSFAMSPREQLAGIEPAVSSIIQLNPLPVPCPSALWSRKQLLCEIKKNQVCEKNIAKLTLS